MPTLTAEDARLRAEAEVTSYCGWHIAPPVRETVTLNGDESGVVLLPTLRLTELHSLTVDGSAIDVNGSAVQWSAAGVMRCPASDGRLRGVVVDMTHGHDEWPLPVISVIERLAARAQDAQGALVQVGQVRLATGSDGLPAGGTLTEVDRLILARYRVPSRP